MRAINRVPRIPVPHVFPFHAKFRQVGFVESLVSLRRTCASDRLVHLSLDWIQQSVSVSLLKSAGIGGGTRSVRDRPFARLDILVFAVNFLGFCKSRALLECTIGERGILTLSHVGVTQSMLVTVARSRVEGSIASGRS